MRIICFLLNAKNNSTVTPTYLSLPCFHPSIEDNIFFHQLGFWWFWTGNILWFIYGSLELSNDCFMKVLLINKRRIIYKKNSMDQCFQTSLWTSACRWSAEAAKDLQRGHQCRNLKRTSMWQQTKRMRIIKATRYRKYLINSKGIFLEVN